MIIHNDFIFVHLQKCGGSFVERFLLDNISGCQSAWPKHRGIITVYSDFKDKLKFGVIRNPFDWYVSWWASNSQAETTLFPNIFTEESKKDFNKFMEIVDKADFGKQHDLDGYYIKAKNIGILTYRFINAFTNGESLLVDNIIKLENLYDGLSKALDLNENQRELLHGMAKVHTSKHRHYSEYYNENSINIVENKDKNIIERFGYSYEENTGD